MVIECPNCGARYTLDEKAFAGRSSVQGKCGKCQHSFTVGAPTKVVPAYGAPTPAPGPVEEKTRVARFEAGAGQLPTGKSVALSVLSGGMKGQVFRLDRPQITVGRSGADIAIGDPEVSRKHCALVVNGVNATLTDLGSTNGTFVGGERITTAELHHLAEFRIGTTTLMFTVTDKEAGERSS